MKEVKNLLGKAKWLIGGNFVFAFSQWVILILFARLTSQDNLGQYSLALAIAAPLFAISNLQLRPLYILDVNSQKKYAYSQFYYLRIIASFLALICCLIWGLASHLSFWVLLLVSLLKFFESYSDIIYAYYNAHDKTKLISKSLFIKGLFSIVAVFLGLYYFDFHTSLVLFLSVYFFVWVFLDNLYILKTKEIHSFNLNLSILRSAIPMGISLGIVTLQSTIPRLFLHKYSGIESVGIFTVLSYFIIVGSIFINSICQYLSPKITGAWNTNIADFKKYLMTALAIAGGLGVLAIIVSVILGEYILNLIYGNAYAVYEKELILIMCAGLALYLSTVLGYTLTAIGIIKQQVYLFSALLILTLFVSYLYIPQYGLTGGIYTLIISYIFQCLLAFSMIFFHLKGKQK
ncbi:polysaccharide biosynthesis protein [Acinetobacter bouvetii]|jgi:O-antigen/teichoic acid export membrane protein|uniref:Polysaccharide biosynthesis protein n=1 Tax=Acinetobacter bouvetii TaxID=202951 RepID=A0A4Q7AUJ1_9GAMM|nr:oligosaccharide flippase family protein [Acinetobacter bouvetii]RZG67112.1 polysaccharide biosynthesis protein [Acinetobacter bouvetii]